MGADKERVLRFRRSVHAPACPAAFRGTEACHARAGLSAGTPIRTEACAVLRPAGPADICCGGEEVFLVGEAAGLVSPSSLEGMSYAFESAGELSAVFNARLSEPGRAYCRKIQPLRFRLLAKIAKCPFTFPLHCEGWSWPAGSAAFRKGIEAFRKETAGNGVASGRARQSRRLRGRREKFCPRYGEILLCVPCFPGFSLCRACSWPCRLHLPKDVCRQKAAGPFASSSAMCSM